MTYVIILNGIVIHCVSVNHVDDLYDCYPDCIYLERIGEENIGWSYDGVTFSPPQGN